MQRRLKSKSSLAMYVMVLPYMSLLFIWGILPIFMAFLEVPHESRANPDGGWDAFKIVVQDFRFLPALIHVLQFMAIFVPSTLIAVIVFSLMLDLNPGKWKKYLRLAFIMPASVSGAVAVLVWYAMLQPTFSPLQGPLKFFGITDSAQVFQTDNLPVILGIMAFFSIAGYWIVIQYGSLQSISNEVIEAARIDGCSGFQLALRIKLPMIKKYIIYMCILIFAGGLQIFVEPQLLNEGIQRGMAEDWSLDQLAYTLAFMDGDFGGAASLAILLLIPTLILALFVIYRTDMFEEASDEIKNKKVRA